MKEITFDEFIKYNKEYKLYLISNAILNKTKIVVTKSFYKYFGFDLIKTRDNLGNIKYYKVYDT